MDLATIRQFWVVLLDCFDAMEADANGTKLNYNRKSIAELIAKKSDEFSDKCKEEKFPYPVTEDDKAILIIAKGLLAKYERYSKDIEFINRLLAMGRTLF